MFITDLAGTAGGVARQQNRKTMQVQDIINVSNYIDKFHFIRESKLPTLNPKKNEETLIKKEMQQIANEDDFGKIDQEIQQKLGKVSE